MEFKTSQELLTYIRSNMIIDGVTIKELARRMGKSNSAMSGLLKQSNVSYNQLLDICNALEYRIDIDISKNDL